MKILQEVDAEGVLARAKKSFKRRRYGSKGPNYVWHIDGYDKLSPYGITIHGCIDGYTTVKLIFIFCNRFSRKIMWLKVSPTNHNPKVIARFYLETVEEVAVCND